jgi:glutathione synthase/RimK-type ligase-like ATP-grasp enzyme
MISRASYRPNHHTRLVINRMKTLAILVTHGYYPSRPDRAEPDYARVQLDLMGAALAPYDISLEPVFWQDEGTDWSRYSGVLPLLAWNYPHEVDRFLACLAEIGAAGTPMMNPAEVLRSNMDKGYIAKLADLGAPAPPTLSIPSCTPEIIQGSFDHFGVDEIIIKPRIGAGAWRQVHLKRHDEMPSPDLLPPAEALIQPFLTAVTSEGELSLLYFGGVFSHALMKTPREGDYRTQGQYGAIERGIEPPPSALEAAQAILDKAEGAPFTYARVDLVRTDQDQWLLMELELIEPWLYLTHDGAQGKKGAANAAKAIAQRLTSLSD